jgi:hypothetical protein
MDRGAGCLISRNEQCVLGDGAIGLRELISRLRRLVSRDFRPLQAPRRGF